MATVAASLVQAELPQDYLSGTPRAGFIDRWIYVFTAALFVAIVLTGFVPDSIMKISMVESGQRPPFPIVLHMHAVLMGSFMLLLLAQTAMMATGRRELHMQLGRAAFLLVPVLVIVGFILVPTIYHSVWNFAQQAPPEAKAKADQRLMQLDNIMLLQFRIGLLFSLFIAIGLRARAINAGLHKRMMILAPAVALPAAFDRMTWLPTTLPNSPLASDLYILLALSPMVVWDLIRNHRVHRAYWMWLAGYLPVTAAVYGAWNTPWWHATAHHIMGV